MPHNKTLPVDTRRTPHLGNPPEARVEVLDLICNLVSIGPMRGPVIF